MDVPLPSAGDDLWDFPMSLFEHFPTLIWRAGIDTKCHYFNQTWLDFTGRSLAEEQGNGWTRGVHSEDFDRCVRTYLEHFAVRTPFEMEYRLRRHDGEYRWIIDAAAARSTPATASSPATSAPASTSPTAATPRPSCATASSTCAPCCRRWAKA